MPDMIPSNNLYREIIDHSAEGIVVYDNTLRCVLWNKRMEEITGVASCDVIGRDSLEVFPFLPAREESIRKLMQRVLGGEIVNVPDEEILIPQSGKRVWVAGIVAPHRDTAGNIIGMVALYRDITSRKLAGNALRESEARYQRTLETAYEGVWTADTKNIVGYANARMAEMIGCELNEIIGKEAFSFVFPEDVPMSKERIATRIAGAKGPFDFRLRRKDGSAQWVRSTATPIFSDAEEYQGMLGMMTDIGEAKLAQEELQKKVSELADLYNQAPCGYHSLDENGVFVKINDTELKWLGYSREEVVGKMRIIDMLTEPSRTQFEKSFRYFKYDDGNIPAIEYEMKRRDGSCLIALAKSRALFDANGKFVHSHTSLFDITESREAQIALRDSELRYRQMFENHPSVRLLADPENGTLVDANPAAAAFYGYPLQAMRGMAIEKINTLPKEEIFKVLALAVSRSKQRFEFRHRLASGEIRDVDVQAGPLDVGGRQLVYSIVHDVTEKKQAEIKLRDSESHYRALIENADDIIYETDALGHFLFINPNAQRLLKYSADEAIGQHYSVVIRPDWRDRVESFYRNQFLNKIPTSYFELPVVAKDGTEVWLGQNVRMMVENERVIKSQAFCRNITERRKWEQELEFSRKQLRELSSHLQSAREAERSKISREIHDELGASLTALKMDLSWHGDALAKVAPKLAKKLADMIGKVDDCIGTVRKIATDLRPSILDNLGLWAAIEWQAQELQGRMNIRCDVKMSVQDLDMLQDEATAIFRIFQETLTNVARHSSATRVKIQVDATEQDVRMEISDNGKGMSKAELLNTQSLGLLGMYERARTFGGEFSIRSEPGQGTVVSVHMPVHASHPSPAEIH
ncbi:MAG: PAS domain S-box protein [Burkholderiales bacterium]